jgi:hypothetical protein
MALKAVIGKASAALLSCLVLGGCAGPDAITHLAPDLSKYGTIEIIHARFPCFTRLPSLRLPISSGDEKTRMELRRHLLGFFNATMDVGDAARV